MIFVEEDRATLKLSRWNSALVWSTKNSRTVSWTLLFAHCFCLIPMKNERNETKHLSDEPWKNITGVEKTEKQRTSTKKRDSFSFRIETRRREKSNNKRKISENHQCYNEIFVQQRRTNNGNEEWANVNFDEPFNRSSMWAKRKRKRWIHMISSIFPWFVFRQETINCLDL